MTPDEFRELALSFPEASEGAHMGHPDFRVRGKIFATLGSADSGLGMVKLTPEQQALFVRRESAVFAPVTGGWGRRGCTHVRLESADPAAVRSALASAWKNAAPNTLADRCDIA